MLLRREAASDEPRSTRASRGAASGWSSPCFAAGARRISRAAVSRHSGCVEELIAEADVSRATFYGFFSSEYSLLRAFLNPVFEERPRRR